MVAIRATSLLFTSVALLSSYVRAYGQIAQVIDAKNFCVFLPPDNSADRIIADAEWEAQTFCTGNAPLAKNAGKLPSGFIQSAHYLATEQYVQVTGQINPIKARLNATDEGGQMDIKAPKGSSCAGWKYYVNLIEPAGFTYCMRCCNDPVTCNRGISEKGCAHIIKGNYTGPMKAGGAATDDGNTGATTSTTTTKKSTTTTKSASGIKGAATPKTTTTKAAVTTTTAPATTTATAAAANGAATDSDSTTKTATTEAASNNTNTVPQAAAADASPSPAAVSSNSDAVTESSASSAAAAGSSSTTANNQMLSQNEQVTGQSVSSAENFQPSMIALAITLIVMVMMN